MSGGTMISGVKLKQEESKVWPCTARAPAQFSHIMHAATLPHTPAELKRSRPRTMAAARAAKTNDDGCRACTAARRRDWRTRGS
eukprot:7385499-Prymnesium_polylepis.1